MILRKKSKIIILLTLIIVGFLAFMPFIPQLSIYEKTTDQNIFSWDVRPGDFFTMSYIHSVNKSKVTDRFVITPDYEIMVTGTTFFSYGAGIPEPTPNSSERLVVYDDRIEIQNIDRVLDTYSFFVGVTADHTLKIRDHSIKFINYVDPKTLIEVSVKKINLISYFLN